MIELRGDIDKIPKDSLAWEDYKKIEKQLVNVDFEDSFVEYIECKEVISQDTEEPYIQEERIVVTLCKKEISVTIKKYIDMSMYADEGIAPDTCIVIIFIEEELMYATWMTIDKLNFLEKYLTDDEQC